MTNFKEHYDLNEEEEREPLNPEFVSLLLTYLEQQFPSYGILSNGISAELRKHIKNGDPKKMEQVKRKIHDIIQREKQRFLNKVQTRVMQLKVVPQQGTGLATENPPAQEPPSHEEI